MRRLSKARVVASRYYFPSMNIASILFPLQFHEHTYWRARELSFAKPARSKPQARWHTTTVPICCFSYATESLPHRSLSVIPLLAALTTLVETGKKKSFQKSFRICSGKASTYFLTSSSFTNLRGVCFENTFYECCRIPSISTLSLVSFVSSQ